MKGPKFRHAGSIYVVGMIMIVCKKTNNNTGSQNFENTDFKFLVIRLVKQYKIITVARELNSDGKDNT